MHFVIWTERYFFVTSISILNSAIKAYLKSWNNFSNDFQGTGSLYLFLAVHNSSIGDLVTHSLTQSVTDSLTFTFDITE